MLLKRTFDLFCCLLALPVYGPITLLIALAIKLDDGGPIFFIQQRVGRGREVFACLKFRTMADGHTTRVGKWLRMCGLDEIAQVINILRGEMSVVGPRPLTTNDIARLGWAEKDWRWSLAPGLTGLAQIYVGRGAKHSLACDRLYRWRCSLKLDIYIVAMSFCINIVGKKNFNQIRRQISNFRMR